MPSAALTHMGQGVELVALLGTAFMQHVRGGGQ